MNILASDIKLWSINFDISNVRQKIRKIQLAGWYRFEISGFMLFIQPWKRE